MSDQIKITILKDGTIKAETDAVSGANHLNAEDLMDFIGKKAGGEVTREAKDGKHEHEHTHDDGHVHVGGGHSHKH